MCKSHFSHTRGEHIVWNYLFRLLRHSFPFRSEKDSALYPETLVTASLQLFCGYKKHLWELAFAFGVLVGNMINEKGRDGGMTSQDIYILIVIHELNCSAFLFNYL